MLYVQFQPGDDKLFHKLACTETCLNVFYKQFGVHLKSMYFFIAIELMSSKQ